MTRGGGLARNGFPIPGDEAALESCYCALPICCADTTATGAIIKERKTATRAAKRDPASIAFPDAGGKRQHESALASPGTKLQVDVSRSSVTKVTEMMV